MRNNLFLLLVLLLTSTFVLAKNQTLDSLQVLVRQSPADSSRVKLLIEIAKHYQNSHFDSTYYYGERAYEMAHDLQYAYGLAESMLVMGISAWRTGNYEEGLLKCERARMQAEAYHFKRIEAIALINIGTIRNYQADYALALLSYQQALRINETLEDQALSAQLFLNIGGIHYNHKDYNQALEFWNQALDLNLKLGNKGNAGSCMNNIALVHAINKDLDQALAYYHKAISMYNEDEFCQKVYPFENIGSLYIDKGNLDSATYYYQKSLHGAIQCKNPIIESASLSGLGKINQARGLPEQALKCYESAIQICQKIGATRELQEITLSLSELHEKMGNLQLALDYFKRYKIIGDSLFNSDNVAEIGRLQSNYLIEKQQREFEIKQERVAFENEKNAERQVLIRNVFIFSLILVIIIASVIYRNYKIKTAANKKLSALNEAIHSQQKELIQQAEELQILNHSLNELNNSLERKVEERTKELKLKNKELETKNTKLGEYAFYNAHQLRAPVAAILGLTALFENQNLDLDETKEIINNLKKSATNLDEVVRVINEVLEKEGLLKKSK
ncbi:Tetratricopeptide repeat-containing protein [Reichenbachiella faecimaris]|uniref:histidine kinase n=1 Tax=Reichenbachiella faecimaris TaxID=692418 RepID=A0A1W2G7L1_REIFA|nr:tetratricopeptide repeat protein [Reichenbachiella faecimaris]SMD32657.1 Tetratricopeptide repeat-containing protein [Reichenbachiella faecimaris]